MSNSWDPKEANRQRSQLSRYLRWVQLEGKNGELPTRIDTLLLPHQQKRLEWLKEQASGRILEVGASWGYVLAYVGGHAGCDINPRLVDLAKIMAPQRDFRVGDARALPYEDGSFNTVMFPEVIEHLRWLDIPRALAEAVRVAKGRVLITTPNGHEDTPEATNPKHAFLMTPERAESLTRELSNLGLEVTLTTVGPFLCWKGEK